ncbi:hypothetical protein PQG02_28970 [Nostoc sp. UHCC 0926]|uniref:hypothetical protein n=1 Tax=unclassified Nostoc TaxID=2593658 RepID=UPI002361E4EA|nr:hypothetical protein [Nostoc sp. UHCC 0926]WDD32634.1 hypothetical protein PQG02_28970 [Nostoc sp. UHCC 0926]
MPNDATCSTWGDPYSPSLTGRFTANGHPTAGATLSRMGEDRSGSPMPNSQYLLTES